MPQTRPEPAYPELKNMPSPCGGVLPYRRIEPIHIISPYKGVDQVAAELVGLLNLGGALSEQYYLFDPMEASLEAGYEAGDLGYHGDVENDLWMRMKQLASATVSNTAQYEDSARPVIVSLAQHAKALLMEIYYIYERFDEDVYYQRVQGGGRPVEPTVFPLSRTEEDIDHLVDTQKQGALWQSVRQHARTEIRGLWDEALSLLWCAQVGIAQSMSFRENKAIWDAEPKELGLKFAPEPSGQEGPSISFVNVTKPPVSYPEFDLVSELPPPDEGGGSDEEEGEIPAGDEEGYPEISGEAPPKKRGAGGLLLVGGGLLVAFVFLSRGK